MAALGFLWLPALASPGYSLTDDTLERQQLEAPSLDDSLSVVEYDVTSEAVGDQPGDEEPIAALPSVVTEKHIDSVFGEPDAPAPRMPRSLGRSAGSSPPVADAGPQPPMEAGDPIADRDAHLKMHPLPGTATRLPGFSDDEQSRFRRQMYRTDI